jgi:hypothetical protein
VGWLIVISTDAIPVIVLLGLACAGYFLGIESVVYFVMGHILALQLYMLNFRFRRIRLWDDEMFLDGKMCASKSLGVMMCVLEGPDGELFLTLTEAVLYDHLERLFWFKTAGWTGCACCSVMIDYTRPRQNV